MNSTSAPTSSQNNTFDSVTRIHSPLGKRISQVIFAVVLLASLILSLQALIPSIEYYRLQAATEIGNNTIWAEVYVWGIFIARNLIRIIFISVGVLIYLRNPYDRISLITSVFLLSFGSGGIIYTQYVPAGEVYIQYKNLLLADPLSYIGWILLFMYFIYFPDGRPIPTFAQAHIFFVFALMIPFAAPLDSSLYPLNWSPLILGLTMVFMLGTPLAAQVYRYRNVATPAQRQQTKVVVLGFVLGILSILLVATLVGEQEMGSVGQLILSTFGDGGFVTIPIALAIAIMRYRLWDVDLIINRSLVYLVVGGVTLLLFFVSLLGIQLVIGQTQPIVALGIAGVCSAIIFQPLRRRVQRFVDLRIYHLRFEIDEVRAHQQLRPITNAGALSGKTLGKYQILDVIGKGGMGEVYKATDGIHTYAIKTLLASKQSDIEIVSRFQREGEIGKRLDHPNIANTHAIAHDPETGLLYLVMDYLEGEDLNTFLDRQKQVDLNTTMRIISDIAAALDEAHAEGLVHRDIKPANVMLVTPVDESRQQAILTDFGISKLQDAHTLTQTGAIGTIGYMAPEQILDARTVEFYADIYALGILTYEMLVGELPFTGSAGQVMFAHIQQPPPNPRDKNDAIPASIAKAIMTALEKDPQSRFASAGEFAAILSDHLG